MKYVKHKSVYVQSYVVGFILNDLDVSPAAIVSEIFENGRTSALFLAQDAFSFIEFKNADSVGWLKEQDWILDFDEYKVKSVQELQSLYKECYEKYRAEIKEFNAKDEPYRLEHFQEFSDKAQKEEIKISALNSLIYYVEHNHEWPRPEE